MKVNIISILLQIDNIIFRVQGLVQSSRFIFDSARKDLANPAVQKEERMRVNLGFKSL